MKCDELKAETIVPQGCTITLQMYPKAEVDAAIAELKAKLEGAKNETNYWCNNLKVFAQKKDAEIAELKAQKAQAEMVDAGMRERRLRRALWLARAWFCGRSSEYFSGMASRCKIGQEDFYREVSERARKYMKSSYKCQTKAEEYK